MDFKASERTKRYSEKMLLQKKDFTWLIHRLVPPENLIDSVHGCQLNLPEIALFTDEDNRITPGFAKCILRTNP